MDAPAWGSQSQPLPQVWLVSCRRCSHPSSRHEAPQLEGPRETPAMAAARLLTALALALALTLAGASAKTLSSTAAKSAKWRAAWAAPAPAPQPIMPAYSALFAVEPAESPAAIPALPLPGACHPLTKAARVCCWVSLLAALATWIMSGHGSSPILGSVSRLCTIGW